MTADVSDVIDALITGTYTVTRREAATIVDGVAVEGDSSTFTVDACVQPPSGRDLQRLPEGMRTREARVVWAKTQLLTSGADQDPDRITIGSDVFEVQTVFDRSPDGNYCRALVLKVGD